MAQIDRPAWLVVEVVLNSSRPRSTGVMPVLARLEKETAALFFEIAKDIPAFEDDVMVGQHLTVGLSESVSPGSGRDEPRVTCPWSATPLLTGILVVRKDDPLAGTKALAGRPLPIRPECVRVPSLLVRSHLAEVDHIDTMPFYAKTPNAYRQVLMGRAGSRRRAPTLTKSPTKYEWIGCCGNPEAAPHPISAHPVCRPRIGEAVTVALLRMAQEPAGQALLKEILITAAGAGDYQRDYQPLENSGWIAMWNEPRQGVEFGLPESPSPAPPTHRVVVVLVVAVCVLGGYLAIRCWEALCATVRWRKASTLARNVAISSSNPLLTNSLDVLEELASDRRISMR